MVDSSSLGFSDLDATDHGISCGCGLLLLRCLISLVQKQQDHACTVAHWMIIQEASLAWIFLTTICPESKNCGLEDH